MRLAKELGRDPTNGELASEREALALVQLAAQVKYTATGCLHLRFRASLMSPHAVARSRALTSADILVFSPFCYAAWPTADYSRRHGGG
eukprot:6904870-Prymnesium_polylepis.1